MKEKKFNFNIDEPTAAFTKHLSLEGNDRIILSAPFGAGKTYFLKEFFKKNEEKYETIHLFPVNYSVASNEDIFELIKFDVLFELFSKNVEFDKVEFSKLDYLPFYLEGNKVESFETLIPFMAFIPKVGKALSVISKQLVSFYKKFEKHLDKIQIDDEEKAIQYLKSFTEKEGSIYEEDFYTQLICQLVDQLKNKDNEGNATKETVLIIDDLDRIDPEHIFRILNVLAAQMDKNTGNNKFDFDKIILVFDQHNVRNIFKNRYGTNVDFTGYIDKFYSYKVFEFSNAIGLSNGLKEILQSVQFARGDFNFNSEDFFVESVVYLIKRLIQANVLSVRRLLKVRNQTIHYKKNEIPFKPEHRIFISCLRIIPLAEFLLFIYEDWDFLLESIQKLQTLEFEENANNRSYVKRIIEESIFSLKRNEHNFQPTESYTEFPSETLGNKAKYRIENSNNQSCLCRLLIEVEDKSKEKHKQKEIRDVYDNPKVFQILYDALNEIKDLGIIQNTAVE